MKRLLIIVALAALTACSAVPTETFNDKAAIAVQTVTTVRKMATQGLLAGKLTKAQDQALQTKLDAVALAVKGAVAVQGSDPAAAAAQLVSALAALETLKAQAGVQQ